MDREKLIEKYVQGQLTAEEQREFDGLIISEPGFKTEVEFHKNLKRVAEAEDDDNFRKLMTDFEQDASSENIKTKYFPTKWLVAASVIVLVGLGYFFMVLNQPTTQELFEENFTPYRNVDHPNERGSQDEDLKTRAFTTYSKGEFESAVEMFSKLYESEKESYYLFYTANALIGHNEAIKAVPLLKEYISTSGEYTDESKWYLALAYLQLEDKNNAVVILKDLVTTGSFKVSESEELLQDLE